MIGSRWWLLLAALMIASSHGCKRKKASPKDPMLAFKRLDELPALSLEVSVEAAESLRQKPRVWVHGTFRQGDTTLRDVGVRLKGHRSRRDFDDKPAIKIQFDKFVKKQRWNGLKRLTLNNMVEDPTMLREVLGYRLYRELSVPAPTAFYARLQINDEDYGLYAVIETVDKQFLEERFADASGGLYEGEYGCDLYPDDVAGFDRDSGKETDNRGDLRALAERVERDGGAMLTDDGPIDMKSFIAYLAVSAFIGDFDGYRHAHNYRIYHEPTLDKWFFIPWGIDRAFKKQLSIYESFGRLARLCFADAACRIRYVRVQRDVVDAFVGLDLGQGARALAAFIEPVITTSKRTPGGKSINRARDELLRFLETRPATIAAETRCIDADGSEIDGDGDGHGCLDCDDSDANVHPGAAEVCDQRDNDCSGAVDDSPSCPTCPIVTVGERRFALCQLPRSWTEAASYCKGLGGGLALPASDVENEAVFARARDIAKERWWLGLSDRETEGTFRGSAASAFRAWSRGEPNNSSCNQDCVVLDADKRGRWRDTHCGQMLPFVCSLPAE